MNSTTKISKTSSQSKVKRILKNTIIISLITIVTILLLEAGARLAWELRGPWYAYSPDLGWVKQPNFVGNKHFRPEEFDSEGFLTCDSEQIADTTKPKILFMGDSNTYGFGVPVDSTFVERLDNLLPNHNVINMGVPGYTSYQGKILLNKALSLNPSLIAVSYNFNDRRYVLREDDFDSDSKFQKMYFTSHFYLLRTVVFLMHKVGAFRKNININTLHPRVPPERYIENLKEIAKICQDKQIPLVFISLNDNPEQTRHLRKGITLLQTSKHDLAIKQLKLAANLDNWFSVLAKKYLARAYREQGKIEEANKALLLGGAPLSIQGGYPIQLDVEYNELMKKVANDYDIEIINAGDSLKNSPNLYLDFCHPNEGGHQKIAHLIFKRFREVLSVN